MDPMTERPYFFVHVLKTGGTSLVEQIRANVPHDARYPHRSQDPDMTRSKLMTGLLLAQPLERLEAVRAFHPHVPFCISQMLGVDPIILTILRDPVARVVSHLRRLAVRPDWEADAESVYANAALRDWWLVDHQTRVFSLTSDEHPAWDANIENLMSLWTEPRGLPQIPMDEDRLALAKANLERVDVLGLTDRFDDLLAELRARLGWSIVDGARRNEGAAPPVSARLRNGESGPEGVARTPAADIEVSDSLRERIAADNQLDIALYEHARAVVRSRAEASIAGSASEP